MHSALSCLLVLFIAITLSSAQYITPITVKTLAGIYGGDCITQSLGFGVSVSSRTNVTFDQHTFNSTNIISLLSTSCSYFSAGITLAGTYVIGNASSVPQGAYNLNVYYTTKTLYFNNSLVPEFLAQIYNSHNVTCFNGTYKQNILYDISGVYCDTLGLYPCGSGPEHQIIALRSTESGTELNLGIGGAGCVDPRPTSFGPSAYKTQSIIVDSSSSSIEGSTDGGDGADGTDGVDGVDGVDGTDGSGPRLHSWVSKLIVWTSPKVRMILILIHNSH